VTVLTQLLAELASGAVEIVDLTSPLWERTPVIHLPPPFANTKRFSRTVVSQYDERGPAWFWHDLELGEHVGTHFDAPIHWITGRDGLDVASIPLRHLIAPAVVIDKRAECAQNPDFLLEVDHVEAWQREHGPLPEGGWLLFRTGWSERAQDEAAFSNRDAEGSHTPGVSVACARWLAEHTPIVGIGVETVGTDADLSRPVRSALPRAPLPPGCGEVWDHAAPSPLTAPAHREPPRRGTAPHRGRDREPDAGAGAGAPLGGIPG
jgi:kynurenine formamidase